MADTISEKLFEVADEQFDKACEEEGFKSYARAFWSGCIKGFVDGCFIVGAIAFTGSCVKSITSLIKRR